MNHLRLVLFNIFFSLTVSLTAGEYPVPLDVVELATVTTPPKAPWLVSMQVHGWHYCGGSIIGRQWILLSAFCTSGKIPTSLVGSSSDRNGGKVVNVKQFIEHENYVSHLHQFDFALLELEQPLNFTKFIQPIPLSNASEIADGTRCTLSAWGVTKNAKKYSDLFQATFLPIINQEYCNQTYQLIHEITPQMICAGEGKFMKNTCRGDEGSPLTCKDWNSGETKLVGLVSWSEGCAVRKYPGVFARVQSIRSWIQEKTGI